MTSPQLEALEPCPWCGDPMLWIEDIHFTHSSSATDLDDQQRCAIRHAIFHAEQIDWWNTRTLSPPQPIEEDVERLIEALEPFADLADEIQECVTDDFIMRGAYWDFRAGDLRKARAAISSMQEQSRSLINEGQGG